jgi:cytochrome b561
VSIKETFVTHKTARYSNPAMVVHWLTALLIIVALPLGGYMSDLRLSPLKLQLISYHKWIGMTVLLLVIARILVRMKKGAPAPIPAPAWQLRAAQLTHILLYALMLAVPLTGWLMSSAKGFPVVYLGLVPIPDLVAKNEGLGDFFKSAHEILTSGLLGLVALHVAAALKHHLVDRDATLRRMLPSFRRNQIEEFNS